MGECVKTSWGSWKVEKDVVLSVIFHSKKERKPSYYKLEKEGMEETNSSGQRMFRNVEKGLSFSTQFGKVTSIYYYPPSKFQNLRCENRESSQ